MSSSLSVAFTPTLMLGAKTMAVFWAATSMAARPASSKPVVPMTAFTPWRTQACRCSSVPSTGEVDQAVGAGQRVQVVGDGDAGLFSQRGAGVLAQRGRVLQVQRHRQFQAVGGEHGFDQHLAHAPLAPAIAIRMWEFLGVSAAARRVARLAGVLGGGSISRAVALLGVLLFLQAGFVFVQTLLGLSSPWALGVLIW